MQGTMPVAARWRTPGPDSTEGGPPDGPPSLFPPPSMPEPEHQTTAAVRTVVHAFYRDMEADPVLGPYFAGLDWSVHLPKMVAFWSSIVFATGEYRGRPFDPHARMPGLARAHFAHWVGRFHRTVDAHFEGERAERL